jgi:hypothetical protein
MTHNNSNMINVNRSAIDESVREQILGGNAVRLLGLT